MSVLVDQGERSNESEQPCPLCADKMLPKALQRHLGKHMEQLVLFIIPGSVEDDGNDESDEAGEVDDQDKLEDLPDDDSNDGEDEPPNTLNIPESQRIEEPSPTSKTADIPKTEDVAHSKTEQNTTADQTEFFEALKRQDIEALKLAVSGRDFDINAIPSNSVTKDTALMYACREGHDDIVKLLLDHEDIQINLQKKEDGWTALMFACRYKMDAAAMKLLERDDIQVNLRNEDFGSTALMLACAEGNKPSSGKGENRYSAER
ncbi:Similar to Putative ankyrin repeat protein L93; acc. no. Q5UPG5 [Pyronema omphalodes CBS 100304]|uniref:Similar to Putative ankyrin repeat protein L93 acc. no. Q5UPG5 n=1 Tax=Pyronema omphalodes (strain CBS 100304) TaxID=1076935 RepID=U4LUH4_PYROM|nr:Similar to Putative ankyrin repeat protein L93; acc. no. Q5UPG5 [Pyronema omphalodes CBS 100304]